MNEYRRIGHRFEYVEDDGNDDNEFEPAPKLGDPVKKWLEYGADLITDPPHLEIKHKHRHPVVKDDEKEYGEFETTQTNLENKPQSRIRKWLDCVLNLIADNVGWSTEDDISGK